MSITASAHPSRSRTPAGGEAISSNFAGHCVRGKEDLTPVIKSFCPSVHWPELVIWSHPKKPETLNLSANSTSDNAGVLTHSLLFLCLSHFILLYLRLLTTPCFQQLGSQFLCQKPEVIVTSLHFYFRLCLLPPSLPFSPGPPSSTSPPHPLFLTNPTPCFFLPAKERRKGQLHIYSARLHAVAPPLASSSLLPPFLLSVVAWRAY